MLRVRVASASLVRSRASSVGAKKAPKTMTHVRSNASANGSANADDGSVDFIQILMNHQKSVARPSLASDARTLVQVNSTASLSTIGNSKAGALRGFPCGSIAAYASDARGRPTLALSSMSQHARDLMEDSRCTVTVQESGFDSVADGRVSLSGMLTLVPDERVAETRAAYLKRHPGAYWVDFGDFAWYEMSEIVACRIVGGFARAASVSPAEYDAATCDPVNAFSAPVCGHMNADHADSLRAMAKHYVGIDADSIEMRSIDRLGMNCRVTKDGERYDLRLPFESPAEDRKSVKDQIVLMTKAAASAGAA
ncbi:root border cell-specific protein [Ostreococcus tauri]|uniref:Root border cell-specific protein n=1 Tax=Ostreococcus tauri TaxID=70448 RepID=A0A1Y5I987_OSTTA|nr:root border cell-specific protein [Ostreococcus tauri]